MARAAALLLVALGRGLAHMPERPSRRVSGPGSRSSRRPTHSSCASRGYAKLGPDTPPDDSLYLALIDRQMRWLAVDPILNDIYTMQPRAGDEVLLLLDCETACDRNGR